MMGKGKDHRATVTDSSKSAPVAALHEVITRNHLGYETVHRVMAVSEADAHAQALLGFFHLSLITFQP